MNDNILSYMSSVFSFIVLIPIIILLYLTITKKIKLRPVFVGIVNYMSVYIISQLFYIGIIAVLGNFLKNNTYLLIIILGTITPVITQLLINYSYNRLLPENHTWRDGVGFGLGLGAAWVISTIGITVFFAMTLHLSISDGTFNARLAELTQDEAQKFIEMKNSLFQTSALDYILLGISGVSAIIIYTAVSIMNLMSVVNDNRKLLYYAIIANIAMYTPYLMITGEIAKIYTASVLLVLAIFSVIYLFKTREIMGDYSSTAPYSRPSPLLRRK